MGNVNKILFIALSAFIAGCPGVTVAADNNPADITPSREPAKSDVEKTKDEVRPLKSIAEKPQSEPTPVQAPPSIKPPSNEAPLKTITNATPEIKEPMAKNVQIVPPTFNRSLMYRPDEVNKVRMVQNIYRERMKNMQNPIKTENKDDILSKLNISTPSPTIELPNAPASIYLNSILFRSRNNAAAWINGKKYDIGVDMNNIKLISLTANTAEIEWRMSSYKDTDINDWLVAFPQDSTADKLPPSKRNIKAESANKTIHFVLRPNQYLDIQGKSIREGKPKPPAPVVAGGAPGQTAGTPLTDKIDMPGKAADPNGEAKAVYKAAADGHYNVEAKVNGQSLSFRVDTGATYPVISKDDARRIGIDVDKLEYKYEAQVANGVIIKSAKTAFDNIQFDNVKFSNITVMVADGNFPQALLGQSFINQYATIDHGTMTLSNPGVSSAEPAAIDNGANPVIPVQPNPATITPPMAGSPIINKPLAN